MQSSVGQVGQDGVHVRLKPDATGAASRASVRPRPARPRAQRHRPRPGGQSLSHESLASDYGSRVYTPAVIRTIHAELIGYTLSTVNFGTFEVITWEGEWSAARHIVVKVSSKLNMKIIEAGYHSKSNILESFLGLGKEYGKVYSGGVLTGNIILGIKKGKIIADSEKLV